MPHLDGQFEGKSLTPPKFRVLFQILFSV